MVSGRRSDCAKVVKGVMLSPRPWRRRRMFGVVALIGIVRAVEG